MYQPQTNYNRTYAPQGRALSFPAVMQKVYLWMTLALAMTGLTSLAMVTQPALMNMVFGSSFVFYGLLIAEVAMVWFLSASIHKLSFMTAGVLFALYAILNGVTLSCIFLVYAQADIVNAFFITAGTFGAMSVVGLFIKKDLSMIGRILSMAVIGLIIALVVNMFLGSSTFDLIISIAGVLIFTGLTAYDTQKIKRLVHEFSQADEESTMKVALMGSLILYLDFINLFLYILRLLGRRK